MQTVIGFPHFNQDADIPSFEMCIPCTKIFEKINLFFMSIIFYLLHESFNLSFIPTVRYNKKFIVQNDNFSPIRFPFRKKIQKNEI